MHTSIVLSLTKNDVVVFEFLETALSFFDSGVFFKLLKFGILPFLFIVVILLVVKLLINHYVNLEILKRKKNVLEATDLLLTQLLFWKGEVKQMKIAVEEFKNSVPYTKRWCRKLIMERILQMKRNFQLDSDILLDIYKLFGFEKVTYDLLDHARWHKRSLGIYQLQFIHDVTKRGQLHSFLAEENIQVKSNALIALVTFLPERFGILANYEETLTKADEIKLMDIIYHISPELPKNTALLLKSPNTSIVVLGIKLMVLYKAQLSIGQIGKLVRLSNFRIRREAIKAVGKLKFAEANDILTGQYRIEQHQKIKIDILISLKKTGDKKTVRFLKSLLETETDPDIKFKIVDALITLEPGFFEEEIHLPLLQDRELKGMALHVKDPLLV